MERKTNQLSFLDHAVGDLGGKRTAAFFAVLSMAGCEGKRN